jgi:hypothetical protein
MPGAGAMSDDTALRINDFFQAFRNIAAKRDVRRSLVFWTIFQAPQRLGMGWMVSKRFTPPKLAIR